MRAFLKWSLLAVLVVVGGTWGTLALHPEPFWPYPVAAAVILWWLGLGFDGESETKPKR